MNGPNPGVPAGTTFFTIADRRFFPGLVGLVNSLRLVGHTQPIAVLDTGLTPDQRRIAGRECVLVPRPGDEVRSLTSLKAWPRLVEPAGPIAFLDSDLIVTRPLDPLLRAAADGRVLAYPDPERDRWYAQWEEIFELPAPPRRGTYVSAHLVVFSTVRWPSLLELWWEACRRVFAHPGIYDSGSGPTAQTDQDALNAVLMSALPEQALELLPVRERPISSELWWVRVRDAERLEATFEGVPTTILHYDGPVKPWEPRARWIVRRDAYVRLLRRLLHGPGTALRLAAGDPLPAWMGPGQWAAGVLRALSAVNSARAAFSPRSRPVKLALRRILSEAAYTRLKRWAQRRLPRGR